jgi:hypothetical protein
VTPKLDQALFNLDGSTSSAWVTAREAGTSGASGPLVRPGCIENVRELAPLMTGSLKPPAQTFDRVPVELHAIKIRVQPMLDCPTS